MPPALAADGLAVQFAAEAYKHGKAVAAAGTGSDVLLRAHIPLQEPDPALVLDDAPAAGLLAALALHRNFDRDVAVIPA